MYKVIYAQDNMRLFFTFLLNIVFYIFVAQDNIILHCNIYAQILQEL